MDPSKEKNQEQTPPVKQKSKITLIIFIVLLFAAVAGLGFYFYTGFQKPALEQSEPEDLVIQETTLPEKTTLEEDLIGEAITAPDLIEKSTDLFETTDIGPDTPSTLSQSQGPDELTVEQAVDSLESEPMLPPEKDEAAELSSCDKPVKQLDTFYTHLDKQAYMANYKITEPSKIHFSKLIKKLLANPPQVTRESDDLYTILKNTAHFFRISGKDNILMMKGILDSEKASLEQILSDYYLLVTRPECSMTNYGNVDKDALYEYACFFLNTMGGRLYLFRRDSLSRMVVTYYAILLVDQANTQNNNRHGIELRPVVDMLISEMEAGGSSLKESELYLDKLYDLKEKYQ